MKTTLKNGYTCPDCQQTFSSNKALGPHRRFCQKRNDQDVIIQTGKGSMSVGYSITDSKGTVYDSAAEAAASLQEQASNGWNFCPYCAGDLFLHTRPVNAIFFFCPSCGHSLKQ